MKTRAKFVITIFILVTTMLTLPCVGDDLIEFKNRAFSDDATSVEEAFFHGGARALVIRNVQPNKLGVGGNEFRVKRNPVGKGCFVYDPRTRFSGVVRNLVWWVINEETAYALNGPSKMVTPSLRWPREDGFNTPSTMDIVEYVFQKKPITTPKPVAKPLPKKADSFTVKEYRIYRAIINTPMSVPEAKALEDAGKGYGVSTAEAKAIAKKVQGILSQNHWFASPETEIKHASDWKPEKP